MTAESVQEWVNSSLQQITNEEFKNCTGVVEVELKPLTDQAVVIVSDIFRAKLTLKYKDGHTEQLKLVYKKEPTKPGFFEIVKELGVYNNELLVYNKVLKLMENLILKKDASKFLQWPKCYLCNDNQFLLEDLTEEDYKLVPSYDLLDVAHALLTVKAIGKYHAMSLILIEQGSLKVEELPKSIFLKNSHFVTELYRGGILQIADFIEKNWQGKWKTVPEKLRKAVEKLDEKLRNLVINSQGKCTVLIHGDLTLRNILFKYENNSKKPTHIKLIDFQGASWSNLAFDVACILCSSLLPQTREEHLDELLEAYSSSLTDCLTRYGYTGDFITLSDIKRAYESFSYWAMLLTLFAIPAFLGDKGDALGESLTDFVNDSSTPQDKRQPLKNYFFEQKPVVDAIKFQLELSLKQNVL